jgi:hypothetical protein
MPTRPSAAGACLAASERTAPSGDSSSWPTVVTDQRPSRQANRPAVDLAHARVHHDVDLEGAVPARADCRRASSATISRLSIGEQGFALQADRQALGHGAAGAQPGERAGAAPEGHGVELGPASGRACSSRRSMPGNQQSRGRGATGFVAP